MPAEPNGEPRLWPASSRSIAWFACLTLSMGSCFFWSSLPALDSAPRLRVALFAAMGVAMLGTIFLFPKATDRNARRLILLSAILLRLILWPAPVSDDVNRYLWEGQLVASGENPYSAPADDPRWESRRDNTWHSMNHRDRPTAYPPGIQWIMAATATIAPSLKSFKTLALLGDLATLFLIFALLRENTAPLRWAGFYAFNPVVLIAFAAEAHFDSLMVAALLAALLAACREKKVAWLWLGIAIQMKLVCLVLVPLFLARKREPRMNANGHESGQVPPKTNAPNIRVHSRSFVVKLFLLSLTLILPSLPFLSALPAWIHAVTHFAGSGAFNAPLFTVLASSGLDLGTVRTLCLAAFALSATANLIARWRGLPLVDSILWMLGALLVCSPIVHFWYLAWLLPLTAIRPSFAWTAASITFAGYFLAWETQHTHGWWGYGHVLAALIWLPWFLAGLLQNSFLFTRFIPLNHAPQALVCCGSSSAAFLPPKGQDHEKNSLVITTPRESWEQESLESRASGDLTLAIVIPALKNTPYLAALVTTLRSETPTDTEIIIATCDPGFPQIPSFKTILSPRGRGNQIAAGIGATTAPWILIAHADATPPPGFAENLREAAAKHPEASLLVCGQRFDHDTPGTLIIEALNELRVVFGGVAFGDQAMVIRRAALTAAGGFPAQPLMEDVEASLRLATRGPVLYLGREWQVSARKWEQGFATRFLMVIRLVATYRIARFRSSAHGAAASEKMYREYYPAKKSG